MWEVPVHVIDFEGSRRSGIVEYGIVTLKEGAISKTTTRLCAPTGDMHAREIQQHGITERMAESMEPFSADWNTFADLRMAGPLCAHNAGFEAALLEAVWACPRSSPDFSNPGKSVAEWGPWLDTLQMYRRLYPNLERHNLGDLIEVFNLQAALDGYAENYCPLKRRRFHCALYDALASACLLLRLLEEPTLKALNLPWLLRQSAASESTRDAMNQTELL